MHGWELHFSRKKPVKAAVRLSAKLRISPLESKAPCFWKIEVMLFNGIFSIV